MSAARPIVVLAGPTASGKTAIAIDLAERLAGEIVGADSVQIYRGFDVGSAKPTPEERARVPHHAIDVLEPDRPVDAAGYARIADEAIASIHARGRTPIVVGGTGLWMRALVRGLVDVPAPDVEIREGLERETDARGVAAMHERLSTVDPRSAETIHPNDRLRIVRALEVHAQTGVPLGDLRAEHALGAPRHPTLTIVLEVPRPALLPRIDRRVDTMLAAGWLDEVRALRARFDDGIRAFGSVGYRQLVAHLRGEAPYEDTVARIRKATKVYARRQRTWWNGEPGVDLRVPPEAALGDDMIARIERHLSR
jgi:tRNA dimethylallyltransferase